jgi:cytochrome c
MHDMQGTVVAHGQNKKSVGKNSMELKDPDGKEFIRERVDMAKTRNKFWQEYKYTDPVTKRVLPKEAYCETLSEHIVCAGVYKR